MNTKNIIIILLVLIIVWFGKTIIELEEYKHSNQTHICYKSNIDYQTNFLEYMEREKCLNNSHPRTSWIWNLYYALIK